MMFGIFSKKKRVLVVGCDGMLGHEVFNRLRKAEGHDIESVNGLDVNRMPFDKIMKYDYEDMIERSVQIYGVNVIVNCMAYTNTMQAETSADDSIVSVKLNYDLPRSLSKIAIRNNCKLIHISTDYVYSEYSNDTFPTNTYGSHKLLGDLVIQSVFNSYSSKDYLILRTSWLYGEHNKKSFVHKFLKAMQKSCDNGEKATVVDDQTSTPTSCEYLADLVYAAVLDNSYYGILQAVPYGLSTKYNFAAKIRELMISKTSDTDMIKTLLAPISTIRDKMHWPVNSWMFGRREIEPREWTSRLLEKYNMKDLSWEDDLRRFIDKNYESLKEYMKDR